jgi:hypothetical protein
MMVGLDATEINRLDHQQIMPPAAILSARLALSCHFTSLSGVQGIIQRYG